MRRVRCVPEKNMTADECTKLLKSRKTEDRIRALRAAARFAPEVRTPLLRQALADKSNYVAALAAEILAQEADELTLGAMNAHFLMLSEDGPVRDPGCHVRTQLAFGFGRHTYSPALEALRIGIQTTQMEPVGGVPFDTAAQLRANCALALAQMNAPGALRDIAPLLFDDGRNGVRPGPADIPAEIRRTVVQALVLLSPAEAIVPIAIKLRFPGKEFPEVLQECMQAAVQFEDPRSRELLAPYLTHPDEALAAYAALMLAQAHEPDAPRLLAQIAQRLSGNSLQAVLLTLSSPAYGGRHRSAENPGKGRRAA